jgi:cullin-associated NEDD8-dissociated protein 1
VDDAIPLRKAALSIFSTSLESCPEMIDISAFLPILVRACDDVEDIQLQAHHIVLCMCMRHPQFLVTNVEPFINPLENAINKKKGSKAGTELERVNELIKSALRVMLALSRLEGASR